MVKRRSAFWYTAPPIFAVWLGMVGWMVQRQIASAGTFIPASSVLQYQPSQDVQWSVVKQNNLPVGYTIRHISEEDNNGTTQYRISETRALAASVNDFFVKTKIDMRVVTDDQFRLLSFTADGLFQNDTFHVTGVRSNNSLHITSTQNNGAPNVSDVPLNSASYLPVSIEPFLASHDLKVGKKYRLQTLDPVTRSGQTTELTVLAPTDIPVLGTQSRVSRIQETINGISSTLFLDGNGNIVREETSDGFVEEAATREDAVKVRSILKF